jgi:hypothetical protein
VGTPRTGGIRNWGRIGGERRLRGVRVFHRGGGGELTLKKARDFTNSEFGPRDAFVWSKRIDLDLFFKVKSLLNPKLLGSSLPLQL